MDSPFSPFPQSNQSLNDFPQGMPPAAQPPQQAPAQPFDPLAQFGTPVSGGIMPVQPASQTQQAQQPAANQYINIGLPPSLNASVMPQQIAQSPMTPAFSPLPQDPFDFQQTQPQAQASVQQPQIQPAMPAFQMASNQPVFPGNPQFTPQQQPAFTPIQQPSFVAQAQVASMQQPQIQPQPQQIPQQIPQKPVTPAEPLGLFSQTPPTFDQRPPAPTVSPETVQQAILSEIEQEELFGRERLSMWQKVVIVLISLLTLGAIAGGGVWVYMTLQSSDTEQTPVAKDTDGDGLSDAQEREYGTDPRKKDTDGDSYSDFEEIKNGYSPLGK